MATSLRTAMETCAARADAGNLLTRPVNAAAATVTSPTSNPSTTGLTNLLPTNSGWFARYTGNTTVGSKVITNLTRVSGDFLLNFAPGMPVSENAPTNTKPASVPNGTFIVASDNTAGTLTMNKEALATTTGVTINIFPSGINIVGGYAASYYGSFAPAGATTGNGVNPPTAVAQYYIPVILEFETDAADLKPGSTQIVLKGFNSNANADFRYRIAINGAYLTSAPQPLGATGDANFYLTITLTKPGKNLVRIELPSLATINSLWVATGARVSKPVRTPAVYAAIYTDSFGLGGGYNFWAPAGRSIQLCEMMGWEPLLVGVSGTGYTAGNLVGAYSWASSQHLDDLLTLPCGPVIVDGSINDATATSSDITAGAIATFQGIRARLPNAPIYVIGVTATTGIPLSTTRAQEAAILSAINTVADDNMWWIPVSSDPAGPWQTPNVNTTFAGGGYSNGAAFTGSVSGQVLTVSAMTTGTILEGQTISFTGITGSPKITLNGTGTGQTGTYGLSIDQGTISSRAMQSGDTAHPADNFTNCNASQNLASREAAAIRALLPQLRR
ncbi:SGNH/GDSL hydrolase family protein [Caulobacter sp. X]|uniref:SGNH/GDSL hydrolase family protein n=1 Tax=Caulobacter sp. X TaxID=2048901 RepID=UPI000C15BDDD|nr:SGNH/GDSL hydrolase family protein [Caulobacter sp. X]PIB96503.1 hypothetical protein CSW60_18520 [Caulobacter sp. X]